MCVHECLCADVHMHLGSQRLRLSCLPQLLSTLVFEVFFFIESKVYRFGLQPQDLVSTSLVLRTSGTGFWTWLSMWLLRIWTQVARILLTESNQKQSQLLPLLKSKTKSVCVYICLRRPEEVVGSPGAAFMGSCQLPVMGTGWCWTWVLWKTRKWRWAISPALWG